MSDQEVSRRRYAGCIKRIEAQPLNDARKLLLLSPSGSLLSLRSAKSTTNLKQA